MTWILIWVKLLCFSLPRHEARWEPFSLFSQDTERMLTKEVTLYLCQVLINEFLSETQFVSEITNVI
jgi:hypothetical protein